MLNWLLSGMRSKAAVLAALYAVCIILSSVAPPVPSAKASAHCLNIGEDRSSEATARDSGHQGPQMVGDRTLDNETGNAEGRGKSKCHVGACCGFSCSAATHSGVIVSLSPPVLAYLVSATRDERPEGCGSNRIARPPKFLLSL
jgi:hypothetical protein